MEAAYPLPADTRERVRDSLQYVGLFPQIGRALEGKMETPSDVGGPVPVDALRL